MGSQHCCFKTPGRASLAPPFSANPKAPAMARATGFTNLRRLHPFEMRSPAHSPRFIATDLDHLPLCSRMNKWAADPRSHGIMGEEKS